MFFGFCLLWVRSCSGAYALALPVPAAEHGHSGFAEAGRRPHAIRSDIGHGLALLSPMLCLVTLGVNTFW